jgi:hypothetical protein
VKQVAGSHLQARLQSIGRTTSARLDRLDGLFPAQKQDMPFQEYLARASVQAQHDPGFRDQLNQALRQYMLAGSQLNGATKR